MTTEQINIRLAADLVSALERVAQVESTDRATVIRRLLEASLRDWETERAVEAYRRGDVSLGRAAEEAGLTQWELLELLHDAGIAYPLDVDDVEGRLRELGGEEPPPEPTLPDLPPRPGGVLLVGINPAPISVAAGHYYQGRIGQRLWRRLEGIGLLSDPVPGHEDEAFARAGHGLTDLVKRPTRTAAELSEQELAAGVEELRAKIREWQPSLVLFAFKEPARRVLGSPVAPGLLEPFQGVDAFLLTGPYAPAAEAERVNDELKARLANAGTTSNAIETTQRITSKDIERGQIRLRQAARRLLPQSRGQVEIVLRGTRVRASYDPRIGPDRDRSPVLRIGRDRLDQLVRPNERLQVRRGLGGVLELV
jgi:double-stranded uracil-DNA glycosylase